jgi:hypothetical protein
MVDVVMSVNMIVVSEQMQNQDMTQTNKNVTELLKALKKVHAYLYEVFFIVKLNAQTLVSQLNRSVDISDAFINC